MKRLSIIVVLLLAVVVVGVLFRYQYLFNRRKHIPPPPKITVCIDPGHPSESNSGRIVQNGICELDMNWQVALKLKELLEQDERITVVLTRAKRDTYMRNRKRALFANEKHASLAIHLHCDTGPSKGFTVYYPDRRGKSEGKRGPSKKVIEESHKAAITIHQGLVDLVNRKDRGLRGESTTRIGRAIGGLTYSIWSEVPTVTIEMAFLSNRNDADYISGNTGQYQMARALKQGMVTYITPQLKTYDKKYAHWRNLQKRRFFWDGIQLVR